MSYEDDVSTIKSKAETIREKAAALWADMGWGIFKSPDKYYAELDWVGEQYKPFYERDPKPLVSILADLEGVKSQLEDPVTEKMDTVKGDLRDWQGTAAEAFVENYLTPFPKTVTNQVEVVVELHAAIQASKEILDRARKDAIATADTTIAALNRAMEIEDKNDDARTWAIIGAVVAVAAAIPTGGASFSFYTLGLGLAAGGAGIAAAEIGTRSITGTDPNTILEQMNDSLGQLDSGMTQEEDILAELLHKDAGIIDEKMDKILPARPAIADDPNSDEFQLPTNPGS